MASVFGKAAAAMAGGSCGALARTALEEAAAPFAPGLPAGIFFANILGSLCMGVLAGCIASGRISTRAAVFLGTGFLGGFTTFSTFAFDAVRLAEEGILPAAAYAACSIVSGIFAAWGGWRLSTRFLTGAEKPGALEPASVFSAAAAGGKGAAGRRRHGS